MTAAKMQPCTKCQTAVPALKCGMAFFEGVSVTRDWRRSADDYKWNSAALFPVVCPRLDALDWSLSLRAEFPLHLLNASGLGWSGHTSAAFFFKSAQCSSIHPFHIFWLNVGLAGYPIVSHCLKFRGSVVHFTCTFTTEITPNMKVEISLVRWENNHPFNVILIICRVTGWMDACWISVMLILCELMRN